MRGPRIPVLLARQRKRATPGLCRGRQHRRGGLGRWQDDNRLCLRTLGAGDDYVERVGVPDFPGGRAQRPARDPQAVAPGSQRSERGADRDAADPADRQQSCLAQCWNIYSAKVEDCDSEHATHVSQCQPALWGRATPGKSDASEPVRCNSPSGSHKLLELGFAPIQQLHGTMSTMNPRFQLILALWTLASVLTGCQTGQPASQRSEARESGVNGAAVAAPVSRKDESSVASTVDRELECWRAWSQALQRSTERRKQETADCQIYFDRRQAAEHFECVKRALEADTQRLAEAVAAYEVCIAEGAP